MNLFEVRHTYPQSFFETKTDAYYVKSKRKLDDEWVLGQISDADLELMLIWNYEPEQGDEIEIIDITDEFALL